MSLSEVAQKAHDKAVLPHNKKWHYNPDGSQVAVPLSTIVNGDLVTIKPGVQLGSNVVLSGAATVHWGAEIGNNVEIFDGTVEVHARIGDDTVIEGGTVKAQAQVGQDNRIETGGVVGERAYTGTSFLVQEGEELEPDSINEFPEVVDLELDSAHELPVYSQGS